MAAGIHDLDPECGPDMIAERRLRLRLESCSGGWWIGERGIGNAAHAGGAVGAMAADVAGGRGGFV
jgi:hypothetical protein